MEFKWKVFSNQKTSTDFDNYGDRRLLLRSLSLSATRALPMRNTALMVNSCLLSAFGPAIELP